MPLESGTRLGSYEIQSVLGAGGMGEVYRARDTKLNRDVALKVLPEIFMADPERAARFQREAQLLASLNHPNIGSIYGLEDSDVIRALVLELVEGPTLADRIAHGPIPLDEALPIARQIAEALEAAHEKGVIHRDLKPANIKVTPDGNVKVLDFGLAKLLDRDTVAQASGFSPGLTNSPTITTPAMTMAGVILGTAAYMSPEQAKGKAADKRSDIWAFGCVLYEMLTGKRAFDGEDVSDTLAAVLRGDPDWNVLPANTPPAAGALLRRCLQKDPKRRLPDIGVARLDIDDVLMAPGAAPPAVSVTSRPQRERWAWTIAAIAVMTAAASGIAGYLRRPAMDQRVLRFTVSPLPDGWTMENAPAPFRISPDGRRLVISARDQTRTALWIRELDSLTSRELPGTDGATAPFWSPDSEFVAFRAGGRLKKIAVSGGQPMTLCEITDIRGGTWSPDGIIVVASGQGLKTVSASGGVPAALASVPTNAGTPSLPSFLPDGRHFLYRTFGRNFVGSLDSPEPKPIADEDAFNNVQYAAGRVLFVRDGTLLAQPFDERRLELIGEARPIADAVRMFTGPQVGLFSVSSNGVLVYESGGSNSKSQLVWFDRRGTELATVGDSADYTDVSLSPDGTRVAVTISDPVQRSRNVWVLDAARSLRTQLTFDPAGEVEPVWSPDGARIAYSSRRQGHWAIYQKPSTGAGTEETIADFPPGALIANALGWTADQRSLLFVSGNGGAAELSILPLAGDRKPVALLTAGTAGPGQLSPDNHWIVYSSNESGRSEVYVMPYANRGIKWKVSTDGGTQPRWRSDGKEIFYVSRDSKIMAAEVKTNGDAFQVDAVRPLFAIRPVQTRYAYDVSPDGERFLVNTRFVEQPSRSPLTVVVNWSEELKGVPAK